MSKLFDPPKTNAIIDEKQKYLEKLMESRDYTYFQNEGGLPALAALLHTNTATGLASKNLPNQIDTYGTNTIPQPKQPHFLQLLITNFSDKILILLVAAACISLCFSLVTYFYNIDTKSATHWLESVSIFAAVAVVGTVNTLNDMQKQKRYRKLNAQKSARACKVVRDGVEKVINIAEISVGDIVCLEAGDIAPADGILIHCQNLLCDESALTGESHDVAKGTESADVFMLSGAKITTGTAAMLTTAVGPRSAYGKIVAELKAQFRKTPLEQKLDRLAERVARLSVVFALFMLLCFLTAFALQNAGGVQAVGALNFAIDAFIQCVAVVVVAVPEGLPMAVTFALTYATVKMLRCNNLVREMSACETMGCVSAVCTDKTGTITLNKIKVVEVFGVGCGLETGGADNDSSGGLESLRIDACKGSEIDEVSMEVSENEQRPKALDLFLYSIIANCNAVVEKEPGGKVNVVGSKTECALLEFAMATAANYTQMKKAVKVLQLNAFSSLRKVSSCICSIQNRFFFFVKGAAETVLAVADSFIDQDNKIRIMDDEQKKEAARCMAGMASKGLRTLGFGFRQLEEIETKLDEADLLFSLTFMSIVGMQDPLRPGVIEAVADCHAAGITVRMITGDTALTAESIGRQCGISTPSSITIEGPVFRAKTDAEIDALLPRIRILARSSPDDKKRLVARLAHRHVVAVTGDGANDVPALKTADAGFAMHSGTDLAKDAATIVLMDDNFASVVHAVRWGRWVYDSVRRFLQFQLCVSVSVCLLGFVTGIAGQRGVFSAVRLLWVNFGMDTMAAVALGTGAPLPGVLHRPPESRDAPLITACMAKTVIVQSVYQCFTCLGLYFGGGGISDALADDAVLDTVVFNTFVLNHLFNLVNCRGLGSGLDFFGDIDWNSAFGWVWCLLALGQVLVVGWGGAVFSTVPLSMGLWAVCVACGCGALAVGAMARRVRLFEKKEVEMRGWNVVFYGFRKHWQVYGYLRKSVEKKRALPSG